MVKYCSAFACRNKGYKGNGIQFHRFPMENKELLKKWLTNVRRENWTPTKYSVLCSDHFAEEAYKLRPNANVRLLREDAIPIAFSLPEFLQKKKVNRINNSRRKSDIQTDSLSLTLSVEDSVEACSSLIISQDEIEQINETPVSHDRKLVKVDETCVHNDVACQTDEHNLTSPIESELKWKVKFLQKRLKSKNMIIADLRDAVLQLEKRNRLHKT